uniref:Uncharacterized protein n=1 Tax=Sphaerodactylus townsendi TaxID=933632 RepID=A0ACB8E745_9SAUR
MQKRGHRRSPLECRNKFKALKRDYKKVVQHNAISGSSPKTCAFYEELDMLLGSSATIRPRNWIMRSVRCITASCEHRASVSSHHHREEDIRLPALLQGLQFFQELPVTSAAMRNMRPEA